MIDKTKLQKLKLRKVNGIEGYFYSDIQKVLSKKEFKNFVNWIRGQTVLLCKKNETLIYRWDFEKWVWMMEGNEKEVKI